MHFTIWDLTQRYAPIIASNDRQYIQALDSHILSLIQPYFCPDEAAILFFRFEELTSAEHSREYVTVHYTVPEMIVTLKSGALLAYYGHGFLTNYIPGLAVVTSFYIKPHI